MLAQVWLLKKGAMASSGSADLGSTHNLTPTATRELVHSIIKGDCKAEPEVTNDQQPRHERTKRASSRSASGSADAGTAPSRRRVTFDEHV